MRENKYKKISEWLNNYPYIGGWLYFNVTNITQDSTSLNSVPGENVVTQFVDGSAEKELIFAIDMVKYYDTGTSDINIQAIQDVIDLSDWIEKQNRNKNYPLFENCVVNEVQMLQSAPSTSVDNEQGLIKYQIQGKINYLEMKGEN